MLEFITGFLGAGIYILMFIMLAGSHRSNIAKLIIAFVIMLLANIFIPASDWLNALVYFTIVSLIFVFLFKQSIFASAANTFVIFLIHYLTAMVVSCLFLYYGRTIADYRFVFKTTQVLYTFVTVLIMGFVANYTRSALYTLGRLFDRIKDLQKGLYIKNFFIVLLAFLFLRLQLSAAVRIAPLKDGFLDFVFLIQLMVGYGMFVWLFTMTNKLHLGIVGVRKKRSLTIKNLISKAKKSNNPLSVIFVEVPGYDRLVANSGAGNAKKLVQTLKACIEASAPGAPIVEVKENTMITVLENSDEYDAFGIQNKILNEYQKYYPSEGINSDTRLLIGISGYNAAIHQDHRALYGAARQNAYNQGRL